jgi:bacteriocin biosynthesis cyclodehydratase domain-containing protein
MLLPGTHVLRRRHGELQVGLDRRHALVLPDTEPVRDTLRLLRGTPAAETTGDPRTLEALAARDLLIDERSLLPLLAHEGQGHPSPNAVAALALATGEGASRARRARSECRLELRTFGHPAGFTLGDQLTTLLHAAGLGCPGPRGPGARRRGPQRPGPQRPSAAVGVLLGVGEPDRELLDDWTRSETPHLLVRLTEGRAVVGPFVVPGRTACLRCLDAHHSDADPAWPLLVRQYADAAARDRPDGAPEPLDPLLAAIALAWAARDLASYVDGQRPSTWSCTLELEPLLDAVQTRSWLRHPGCGCTWADTMGA